MVASNKDSEGSLLPREKFLDVDFTNIDLDEALSWLRQRTDSSAFGYVVTPNVDHVLNLHRDPQLRRIYNRADLCLCDSRVLAILARGGGIHLNVAPGSELVSLLLQTIEPARSLCLIGSNSDIASRLAKLLPHVKISWHAPPMGLRHNAAALEEVARFVRSNPSDYILLAVGSPQQEIVADLLRQDGNIRGTALCIGAAVNFFTGESKRAPRWMQRLSIEWAYRLLQEPRRLAYRYLVKGPAIFPAYANWLLRERRK